MVGGRYEKRSIIREQEDEDDYSEDFEKVDTTLEDDFL